MGQVAIFRAITQRKRAEQELQNAKDAEAANRAKSQFLANVSQPNGSVWMALG